MSFAFFALYTPRAGGHKFGHIESRSKGSILGFVRVENLVSHILRVLKVLCKVPGGLFCHLYHLFDGTSGAHPERPLGS